MRVVLASDPGTPGRANEDFAAASTGAAVLLDGATTFPIGADTGCVHGVAWYARALGTTLLAAITAEPRVPLTAGLAEAISEVRGRHADSCDLASPLTPAATVTAVRADPGGISYLALSDSSIAADYGNGRPPLVITDTHQPARASPGTAAYARTGTLALDGLRGVALLSDGAARIADRYRLLDWRAVLSIISDGGPEALIRQVRQAEAADPDRTRWPRSKTSDDATVLWWQPVG
jgi:hypothetical protein